MLLARYAPIGSPRYEKLSKSSKKLDKIIEWLSPQLFAIWSIFVAGMSAGKANIDRHYFWDGSDWLIGIIGITIITIVLNLLNLRIKDFPYKNDTISFKNRGYYAFMPLILMVCGFAMTSGFNSAIDIIIYLFPWVAIYLIYTIKVEVKSTLIPKESNKYIKAVVSSLLLIVAIIIGITLDDPVITTASIVTLPFIIILLFGNHVRHLERAKFYPIFIFAMFVSSREAWFLIPLFLLFHILRTYNYLNNQRVYPTFGVSDDSNR